MTQWIHLNQRTTTDPTVEQRWMVNRMDKETYVRAVLECNFAGFKDEIIETAVRKILEYDNGLRSKTDC